MNSPTDHAKDHVSSLGHARSLAELAFARAAGAPLIGGNALRILIDAQENFGAWREAIRAAEQTIFLENYIICADATGAAFRDQLAERAAAGVKVRVLLDWFGSSGTPRKFWRPLVGAGGEVRYHNTPFSGRAMGWLSRDHRKSLVVDGTVGSVSGVCVSDAWLGDAARKIEPWRDTGVELRGPAVADLVAAFAQVWAENGAAIPDRELAALPRPAPAGEVAARVIATAPGVTGVYRLDLLIAMIARRRLWLTDAYFAGTPSYIQALRSAARDGVDVRLLVPGGSDLPWLRPLTTAGYRPLVEAGVRVFEWNGSMLHAKTAVADDRWARVGSTNLNMASWLTNFELDVAVEDHGFAAQMAAMYEQDLHHATEVVLKKRKRVRVPSPHGDRARSRPAHGGLVRATAGALRVTRALSAAVVQQRVLGQQDARALVIGLLVLVALAAVVIVWPRLCAWTAAVLLLLAATVLAGRLLRERRSRRPR